MKNKAALIVLVILTAGFFIFMALMFGSGAQVQAITERKLNVEAGLDAIAESDITIYWIGELPKELEHLSPVVNVIAPENITRENIPVRGPAFHIEEYTPEGLLVNEEIPREYSAAMKLLKFWARSYPTEDSKEVPDRPCITVSEQVIPKILSLLKR